MPNKYYGYSGKVQPSGNNQNMEFLFRRMVAEAQSEEGNYHAPELTALEQIESKQEDRPSESSAPLSEQSHSLNPNIPVFFVDSSPSAKEMRAAYQSLPALMESASEMTPKHWVDKKV